MARVLTQKVPFNNTAELTGGDWANATVLMDPATGLLTAPNNPGTGATNLGKAEDAPHTSGDVGVMVLGVRNDTGTTLAGSDLDYIPFTITSNGQLEVAPGSIISAADGASNFLAQVRNHGTNGSSYLGSTGFLFNGATWDRARTPAIVKSTSWSVTGLTTIWTPGAGKKVRLMKYQLWATADAAAAAAADQLLAVQDGGVNVGLFSQVFIPAAAATTLGPGWTTGLIDLGNGILSSAANNAFGVNVPNALTAGRYVAMFIGTEE